MDRAGWSHLAAVVPAGGAGRRMGGGAKPALRVGGIPMLARVLAAVEAAAHRVVVGPAELAPVLPTGVTLTSEDPAGGGPVAALVAGLTALPARPLALAPTEVAVVAGDLPFLVATTITALHARLRHDEVDAVVLRDDTGRAQWLCGVWRLAPLRAHIARLGTGHGRGMRELASGLRVTAVPVPTAGPPPWFDCDTVDDLRRAEEWVHDDTGRMER